MALKKNKKVVRTNGGFRATVTAAWTRPGVTTVVFQKEATGDTKKAALRDAYKQLREDRYYQLAQRN